MGTVPVLAFRKHQGITLRELSERTGVRRRVHISEIERGLELGSTSAWHASKCAWQHDTTAGQIARWQRASANRRTRSLTCAEPQRTVYAAEPTSWFDRADPRIKFGGSANSVRAYSHLHFRLTPTLHAKVPAHCFVLSQEILG